MFFAFRVQDNSLSSFNAVQRKQIKAFQAFIMEKPDSYCCVCLKLLYKKERKFREITDPSKLPCLDWNKHPLMEGDKYIVCSKHKSIEEDQFIGFVYPGMYIFFWEFPRAIYSCAMIFILQGILSQRQLN